MLIDLTQISDPSKRGFTMARLEGIARYGFEVIESSYPGHAYRVRCKKCGHELSINQCAWQFRHSWKHD